MTTPDVVGATEGARILGVSRQRFAQLSREPGFPPATHLDRGRIWNGADLRAFADERAGRSRALDSSVEQKRLAVLAHYREHGSINQARLHADVKYDSARRWLIRAGLIEAPLR